MSNWHPNIFESHCKGNEYDDEFVKICLRYGKNLHSNGFPVVFSLAHLAELADSNYSKLREIIHRRIVPYGRFKIHKRSGGYRQIVVPHPYLFVVQKWINSHILSLASPHRCAKAYIKGACIVDNANIHCGARWLIKMDLRRFFESVTEKQVYHVFSQMGYTSLLSFEMARLCTIAISNSKKATSMRWSQQSDKYELYKYSSMVGHLPQGAPTSPMLSNLIFRNLDDKIEKIAADYDLAYTRYSDDIILSAYNFSRSNAKKVISEISIILSKSGFRRNMKKTHIIPPGARKIVTGLTVNHNEPKIQKELKQRIENHLYYATKFGPQSHCQKKEFKSVLGFKNHLKGLIDFVKSVNPVKGGLFLKEFHEIKWPELL